MVISRNRTWTRCRSLSRSLHGSRIRFRRRFDATKSTSFLLATNKYQAKWPWEKSWLRRIASALKRQTQRQITRRVESSYSVAVLLLSHLAVIVFEFESHCNAVQISNFFLPLLRLTYGRTNRISIRSDPVIVFRYDHDQTQANRISIRSTQLPQRFHPLTIRS